MFSEKQRKIMLRNLVACEKEQRSIYAQMRKEGAIKCKRTSRPALALRHLYLLKEWIANDFANVASECEKWALNGNLDSRLLHFWMHLAMPNTLHERQQDLVRTIEFKRGAHWLKIRCNNLRVQKFYSGR